MEDCPFYKLCSDRTLYIIINLQFLLANNYLIAIICTQKIVYNGQQGKYKFCSSYIRWQSAIL